MIKHALPVALFISHFFLHGVQMRRLVSVLRSLEANVQISRTLRLVFDALSYCCSRCRQVDGREALLTSCALSARWGEKPRGDWCWIWF
eukprot:6196945-Pleurochrysis_carterae.AAC.4